MRTRSSLLLGLLLLYAPGSCAPSQSYRSIWQSTVNLAEIGKGDLNQTYGELLEYFFPRQLSPDMGHKCYLVVRYLPAGDRLHQLNLIFDKAGISSVWAFELRERLPLESSDQAQRLAETIQVRAWHLDPSARMKDLVSQSLNKGFLLNLHPGIMLHGDVYKAWGDCDLSRFETEVTVPASTRNNTTNWMNDLWKEAKSASGAAR